MLIINQCYNTNSNAIIYSYNQLVINKIYYVI